MSKEKATEIKEFPIVFGSHEVKLKGKVLLPRYSNTNNPVPGAVLCHGLGAGHRAMEPSARTMASQGIATLIFDFRGHGSSEGAVDGKMVEDVVDAWNFLSQFPEVDRKRMGLIGHSLGAISAIMAAEKVDNPQALIALSCPPDIDSLPLTDERVNIGQWGQDNIGITEHPKHGAFPWLRGVAALVSRVWMYLLGYRVRVDWQKFTEALPQMKMPKVLQKLEHCSKFFAFCEGDKVTPYHKSVFVYESACEPKEMLLAKGGSHTTPLLPGNLRSQWTSWAVRTLTAE
ncbi:MAG TPA: alpha/beta fold hydrolase [Dehalococcoidia bacterium]|nr:alpha/beta fold hydrolase [Dehalococcoidia bacterium]